MTCCGYFSCLGITANFTDTAFLTFYQTSRSFNFNPIFICVTESCDFICCITKSACTFIFCVTLNGASGFNNFFIVAVACCGYFSYLYIITLRTNSAFLTIFKAGRSNFFIPITIIMTESINFISCILVTTSTLICCVTLGCTSRCSHFLAVTMTECRYLIYICITAT